MASIMISEMENGDYVYSLRGRGIVEGVVQGAIIDIPAETIAELIQADSQLKVNNILREYARKYFD